MNKWWRYHRYSVLLVFGTIGAVVILCGLWYGMFLSCKSWGWTTFECIVLLRGR